MKDTRKNVLRSIVFMICAYIFISVSVLNADLFAAMDNIFLEKGFVFQLIAYAFSFAAGVCAVLALFGYGWSAAGYKKYFLIMAVIAVNAGVFVLLTGNKPYFFANETIKLYVSPLLCFSVIILNICYLFSLCLIESITGFYKFMGK